MKNKIIVMSMSMIITALLVGCAKINVPSVEKVLPVKYELAGLYLTTDPKQMSGVPRSTVKLGVGESVVVYARGMSPDGKWFELPADVVVNWKADRQLEVYPTVGHVVTVKVVKPISVSSYVEVIATTKDGKKVDALFTVRE